MQAAGSGPGMTTPKNNNLQGIGLMLPAMLLFQTMDAAAKWLVNEDLSAIAPFEYSALVWAAALGYLIWLEIPTIHVWAGAVIIIGSGLYVIHRESLRHRSG